MEEFASPPTLAAVESGHPAGRVAIGICTAHRPEMLKCCLAALAAQAVPEGVDLTLVIADNEAEPNNRTMVEEFAASCPFPVVYVHEPERGISRARNAVLDACEDRVDWIAMTDDDCMPEPAWLSEMLAAAKRYGADVVRGRHVWVPPEAASFWYAPPPSPKYAEGQRLDHAGGGNVLFAGRLAGLLRFDEHLAHGEDTDYFYRASNRYAARIVYTTRAVVRETIPPHRATLRYQTARAFYFAASRTHFHRRHGGFDGATARVLVRLVWQVPIAIIRLATAPLVWPFSEHRFKSHVVRGMRRLAGAAGAIVGLAGFSGNPYRGAAP